MLRSWCRSPPRSALKHAAFAMGKFALRGLAQSAARELGPKGIHIAHFVIDGAVRNAQRPDPADRSDTRSRRDRSYLSRSLAPAAQRLVVGGRASAMGRELLKANQDDQYRAVSALCQPVTSLA